MENRKFIQAMFDQTVFDSLFDSLAAGNGESTISADFSSKSLTPDLHPLTTQTHLQVNNYTVTLNNVFFKINQRCTASEFGINLIVRLSFSIYWFSKRNIGIMKS